MGRDNYGHYTNDNGVEIRSSVDKYGTEAIKATLDFCKEKFNIEKYELFVYKNNLNAIRCYENIGFKIDGNGISQDDVHMKL